MSTDYFIGISRAQLNKLTSGVEIGKRPYDVDECHNHGEIRYNGCVRIHIKLLSDEETREEPDAAFSC